MKVGDKVKCHVQGSWVDGLVGTILALNVTSSDEIHGHQLQMHCGVTVVEPEALEELCFVTTQQLR